MRPSLVRGVRGRLVTTYVLLALVVVAIGGLLFVVQVERGFSASTDANLDARGAALAADVRTEGEAAAAEPATRLTVAEIYRPDGSAVSPAEAGAVPASAVDRARSGRVRLSRHIEGADVRLLALPVDRPDGTWVVVVGTDTGPADEATDRVEAEVLVGAPLLVLVAAIGAWVLSGSALRPVERMRAEAADLGAHDAQARISDPGTADELAALAATFNDLLDRLQVSSQRQRAFVADAGHELRTPLAVLWTELELADRPGRSQAELADAVVHARSEVQRLSRLADQLLVLAGLDEGRGVQREPVRCAEVLEAAVRASRSRADAGGVEVGVTGDAEAHADPVALRRIVDNLLGNALAVTPPGGRVDLGCRPLGPDVEVRVSDTGPGFPADFLPHARERFRRHDASRTGAGGSGLGLAIVDELVRAHGGTLTIANGPAGGADVLVRLPRT